mgnify:CR=1 FL=1|jgi:hypothetical protein
MKIKNLALFLVVVLAVTSGCSKDDRNAPRTDGFELHALADCSDEPLKDYCIDILESTSELYIKTEHLDFDVFWQDAAPAPWLEVISCEQTSTPDIWKVTLKYKRRSENGVLYTRRSGTLSVAKPDVNVASFLQVHQGAIMRTGEDFADFKYGSWLPTDLSGDKLISEWTNALTKKGFSSEVSADQTPSCYGRYGHLRIGEESGKQGSLITPTNSLHRYDSLLMVTFKAASWPGDDKSFKVEVSGGGVIRDFVSEGRTSITLQTEDIVTNAVTPEGMWKPETNFMVFIASTEKNPVGVNTCLKITSGASSKGGSRLFIDDYYVVKLVDGQDVDYYQANQGSGRDKILASNND